MNYRDTLLEININNLIHNIDELKRINKNKKIKAVVKANAYGHGLEGLSHILEKYALVDAFCVSNLDEALALRKNGISLPILVLGAIDYRHFDVAFLNDIAITIYSKEMAEQVLEFNKKIKVQFKIDTAMNRIGFVDFKEFQEVYNNFKNSNIIIDGIFSHFSSAEDDAVTSKMQIDSFKEFLKIMPKDIEVHIQNSAGSINYNDLDFVNNIRLGICLYGCNPVADEFANNIISLKEIATLKSRVIMIKDVPKNQTISYNRTYKLDKNSKIATIPIGYADGYKLAYNNSFVYTEINDEIRKYYIRGKICMDQLMIEVDNDLKVGDYVTLIGEHYSVEDISSKFSLSKYEILTSLSARLYKKYILDGEVVYEDNQILPFYKV